MKVLLAVLGILVLGGLLIGGQLVSARNNLVEQREAINSSWAQVDVAVKTYPLIPMISPISSSFFQTV